MPTLLTPQRPLGATGVTVPLVGYGTAPLGKKLSKSAGADCIRLAIDLGITYLDTSPDYGSEPVVGEVMKDRRQEVFLATKINKRKKESVIDEIGESLKKLKTDYVDLIQVHAVNAMADLEQVTAPGGALEGLEEARNRGMVRFIGITGHARPEVLACALERYPFDTVLVATGMADRLVSGPETFLLPRARAKNIGVIAMKVLGHGEFPEVELALRYSLGLPGVSLAIVGMDNEKQVQEIAEMGARYRPLDEVEEARLIEQIKPIIEKDAEQASKHGKSPLFWLHDSKVMGWSESDEPEMATY